MKKFLQEFKSLNLAWKLILPGTLILFLGSLFEISFMYYLGAGVAIGGWLWGASRN